MSEVLIYAGGRANRTLLENYLRVFSAEQAKENISAMWDLCDHIVADRRANPNPDAKDLLNVMLTAADPDTGEKLSDENIRFNMVTFLVAGHETTSGTLSFLFYHLLKNPDKYHTAQAEVDKVVGNGVLEVQHLPRLKYLEACLRETLRYQGPISRFQLGPKEETLLANRYRVHKNDAINVNIRGLHHDPAVWGPDHEIFKPERMLNGGYESLPPNAFKPFGTGSRACIGRAFAEQEMLITATLILQRFQIELIDPSYNLRLKSTLTVKPGGLGLRARRRPGKSYLVGLPGAQRSVQLDLIRQAPAALQGTTINHTDDSGFKIVYGSNSGTCKSLADDLQTELGGHGIKAIVETMDKATENLPVHGTVLIITPSYEGKPPDNAKKFVAWLETGAAALAVKDVSYAVFGVGNSDWASTFHRVPCMVNELMQKMGGKCLLEMGLVDVKEDFIGPWDTWKEQVLHIVSSGKVTTMSTPSLAVSVETPTAALRLGGPDLSEATVTVNRELAGTAVGPAKRHVEVELAEGMTYQTGDYLVVQPTNPTSAVKRVLTRFHLHPDDIIRISSTSKSFLTENNPTTAVELIGARLELATPISQRQLQVLAGCTSGSDEQRILLHLSSDEKYKTEVLPKRLSIIDVLEDHPQCNLGFDAFLDMMKPLSPRQYSISSSPLRASGGDTDPVLASVTFDVHNAPALSGRSREFKGIASTYLATRPIGGKIRCAVRPTNVAFHMPSNLETPLIMICAGTGVAPMRGFVQERAEILRVGGQGLGKALLFFGCRDCDQDYLYEDEFREWERLGAVDVRPAFSKHGLDGEHYKYVHDRIWAERDEVAELFRDGAKILVCGSAGKLAKSCADACRRIWLERHPGKTEHDAELWLDAQREERYVSDVF